MDLETDLTEEKKRRLAACMLPSRRGSRAKGSWLLLATHFLQSETHRPTLKWDSKQRRLRTDSKSIKADQKRVEESKRHLKIHGTASAPTPYPLPLLGESLRGPAGYPEAAYMPAAEMR